MLTYGLRCIFNSVYAVLATIIASPRSDKHVVFFVVIPAGFVSLSSLAFRQLLLFLGKTTRATNQLIFHLVPEHLTYPPLVYPSNRHAGFDVVSLAVYDRLLQPSERFMSRRFFVEGLEQIRYFQVPAFSLSRKFDAIKFEFTIGGSRPTLDTTERNMMLQVAYQVSRCGKWIVATCTDQLGEAHDIRVWAVTNEEVDEDVVMSPGGVAIRNTIRDIWEFVSEFARKADIEWRVVVTKVGVMDDGELNGKSSLIASLVRLS